MNALNRVIKNTIALSATELLSKVLNFVFIAVLARNLAQTEFGGFSTIMTMIWMLGPLVDLGVSQIMVREIAADHSQAERMLSNGLVLCLGLTILANLGVIVAALVANYPDTLRPWVAVSGLAVAGYSLAQTGGAVLRGFERMEIQAVVNSAVLLLTSLLGIGLAMTPSITTAGFGVGVQVLLVIATSLAGTVVTLAIVHRHFARLHWAFDARLARSLLSQALPIAALGAYNVILRWIDVLILGQVRSMEDVAVYSAANKILDVALVISSSAVLALFPVMTQRWRSSIDSTRTLYEQALRVFTAFGIAATVGLVMLAEPIAVTVFGERYRPAELPLAIVSCAFVFMAISSPMGMLLMVDTSERLRKFLPMLGGLVLGNVALNVLLAPRLSYIGSAIAYVLTAVAIFVVSRQVTRSYFARPPQVRAMLLRPAAAALAMGIILWVLKPLGLLVTIPAGGLVFMIILMLLGEWKQEPYHSLIAQLRLRFTSSKHQVGLSGKEEKP